ncbi:putative mediator of RNA polymerase II transcription subunit 26 isoform X2 [Cydia pomonella]|uniref:putative mediator of RNA polymerase II transcription subunit 26 isoform X2 n=1 Tax=Cydia pomonella TaxID=82600 RepID=UPI002ADD3E3B|nr:putative mediator of RNA polymerase II transcription subunit 26 isoform X2 [Cydia pomonella]
MKLLVATLLLVAACHAEVARSKQKEDSRMERRAEDGVVQKRAPAILPTVTPSTPGIEYADSKDSQTEKTPVRQIYAQPESQVAKISDVLTGQGPPFPAAIASHLFSPIPVYQPRLSSPTTYEISAPIPSQLAYSEHKITYQPQQNAIQLQEYNPKLLNPKQAIARLTVNYQPYQQLPQPLVYQPQPIQQFPVYQQAFNQPIQYQGPAPQYQNQGYQPPLIQLVQAQPGINYADEGISEEQHQRPAQRELKTGQPEAVKAAEERAKSQPLQQQNYNVPPQGAYSYASFSVGAPTASYVQPQQLQYQPQQQHEQQLQQQQYQQQQLSQQQKQSQQQEQPQQQIQYQPQPQQYQQQQQSQQQQQYQPQPLLHVIQYQPQPQYQLQQLPARQIKSESQNLIPIPTKQRQIFIRQGPVVVPYQAQVYQAPTPAYQAAAPHFPPVQYFGKFAHSIFGQ